MLSAVRGRHFALAACGALVASTAARDLRATDCDPDSGISTCIDSENLWQTAGPTRFVSIAPAGLPPPGRLAVVTGASFASRPVQLNAPSPDASGRDVRVVDYALNLSLGFAFAVSEDFELTLATPMALYQAGAGAEGVTSQSAPPLGSTAVRDPRIGVGFALPVPGRRVGLDAKARLELAVPFGDEDLYAGDRGFVLSPSLALGLGRGRLRMGAELGARLRRSAPFATARVGPQLLSAVGASFDLLDEERLSLVAEAFVLPTLVDQPGRDSGTRHVSDGVLVPAEWLASVRSAPFEDRGLSLQLGGGTALPLSSETVTTETGSETEHFAGVTSPRFRLVFAVRYAAP